MSPMVRPMQSNFRSVTFPRSGLRKRGAGFSRAVKLRRMPRLTDVAALMAFIGPGAAYITEANLTVDGATKA